ncbi:hypothetical protein RGE_02600 [Rubrivivax gelatinosus IL144]|uniref:Uncharacterized protein n=1 Tax=Rubrivivax gelatinosus (strain NBRC 100245 / IL144) TaxID=983917 RepID=I0HKR8_RUBGI|nr:hypothetical protein RGE_02600 [Rubrivivax gelatinosus IL144]
MTPPVAPSALPPRGAPPAARQSRLRGGRLMAPHGRRTRSSGCPPERHA